MIKKLLKTFPCFKGVFPCDQLPYDANLPINIIANTDPANLPGEHWICISIKKNGRGQYFDSFGLPPLKEEFFNFLERKCTKGWSYNKVALQNLNSQTCGHYCVLYVIFKCQDLSYKNFISKFNSNTLENDKRMLAIFKNFSLAKKIPSSAHQIF
jgi:hypothetical protein